MGDLEKQFERLTEAVANDMKEEVAPKHPILLAVHEAQGREKRSMEQLIDDWKDRDQVNARRRELRLQQREEIIPKHRTCPGCKLVVVDSARWVIKRGKAICRSCYQKQSPGDFGDCWELVPTIFAQPTLVYTVNQRVLDDVREANGITVREICNALGISIPTYYNHLKHRYVFEVNEIDAQRLRDLFVRYGVMFDDSTDAELPGK